MNQSYQNFEILVIDNLSKDNTIKIIRQFKNKKKIKIFSQSDKGMYYAINFGIKKSSGKYISYCNSDDFYISKGILKKIYNRTKELNHDLVITGGTFITKKKKKIIMPKNYNLMSYIFLGMPTLQNGIFWKNKYQKFNILYKVCSDYDFFSKFYLSKKRTLMIMKNYVGFVYRENSFGNINKKIGLAETSIIRQKLAKKLNINNYILFLIYLNFFRIKKLLCIKKF